MPDLVNKFFNSKIDLNLPETPRIREFTKEELYNQLLDVYNALRILQAQSDEVGDLLDILNTVKPPSPKRYMDL